MKELQKIFKKADVTEIIRQYWHAHILAYAFLLTVIMGTTKKSLEIVRLAVSNRLLKKLRRKYGKFIKKYSSSAKGIAFESRIRERRRIWICWFQGMENAPPVVKFCYRSMKTHIRDREIVVITRENYQKYVQFPEHIRRKIDLGKISLIHMSDLLRLELLFRYGGTWMDATVFCTGGCPSYMLDSDLFVFQNLKPGLDGAATCMSSWFMTARPGGRIIRLTLELLYRYWDTHDRQIDYFLLHSFFQLALEVYPEEWNGVIPCNNATPHILLLRLFEPFDENAWEAVKAQTPLHKLSYKIEEEDAVMVNTYYQKIVTG